MLKGYNKKIIFAVSLAVFGGLLIGEGVLAQINFTTNLGNFPVGGAFTIQNLVNLIRRSACYVLRFGIICVAIALVVYGISLIGSRGSPQGFTTAKKSITWGIVGGLIIYGVFTIVLSIAAFLGVSYPIAQMVLCT